MFEIIVGLALIPLALYGLVILLSILFATRSIVIPIVKAILTVVVILIAITIASASEPIVQPFIYVATVMVIALIWAKYGDNESNQTENVSVNKHTGQ